MSVRAGNYSDIPRIIEMSEVFWEKTIYEEPIDPASIENTALSCIENNMMAVLDIEGAKGFACGVVSPLLGNNSVLAGTEIAWWVEPDYRKGSYGIKLLKLIESLAKDAGVKYWSMVFMESSMPDDIKRIYEALGYELNETTYTKVL